MKVNRVKRLVFNVTQIFFPEDDDEEDEDNNEDDNDEIIKIMTMMLIILNVLITFPLQLVKLEPPVIAILAVMPPPASPVSMMAPNIHVTVPQDSQELTVMVGLYGALKVCLY